MFKIEHFGTYMNLLVIFRKKTFMSYKRENVIYCLSSYLFYWFYLVLLAKKRFFYLFQFPTNDPLK